MTFGVSRGLLERVRRRLSRIQRRERASEELRRMSLRTVMYRLFTISPLVLAGTIAAESRFHLDMFQTVACTSKQENEISAYIEPVRQAEKLLWLRSSPDKVRRVAAAWIEGAKTGHLKPLEPVSADDSIETSIKGEIASASRSVQAKLMALSKSEAQRQEYAQAIEDAMTALRVGEVIKYSDAVSLANTATTQRGIIRNLSDLTVQLDA